jgi:phosphoribosylglycinamide formyltransferase-1
MYKIGWFSTGRGRGSRDLLTTMRKAILSGEVIAEIDFVFCSREFGENSESDEFIDLVKEYKIPLVCYSYRKFKETLTDSHCDASNLPDWRLEYDREVIKLLASYNPNLIVLAGYMLIVGREMCQQYDMINLHPAKPDGPTGSWQGVIWELINSSAEESGVMIHLVTPELDRGPLVSYCTYPLIGEYFNELWQHVKDKTIDEIIIQEGEANKLFRLIRRHGLQREFPLIVSTIQAFSRGDVKIIEKKVVDRDDKLLQGYNLTAKIEDMIKQIRR